MFHRGCFVIEDWFGPFKGWTTGQQWNGCECPYFEFETALRMVDAWNKITCGEESYQACYDAEHDAFCFCDGGLEEWDCFRAQMIESAGQTIKVYPIGAFCWVWDNEASS